MAAQTEHRMLDILTGAAGMEAIGGVAAGILAILGLVGVAPLFMTSIAAIVIGVALLVEGVSAGTEISRLSGEEGRTAQAEVGGGLTIAILGGLAATVLGLLSLLGVAPSVLLPVSAIVVGGSVAMCANVPARLNAVRPGNGNGSLYAVGIGASADVMVGMASVILGILAIVGVAPGLLTLIALLASAVALLLSGFAGGSAAATHPLAH